MLVIISQLDPILRVIRAAMTAAAAAALMIVDSSLWVLLWVFSHWWVLVRLSFGPCKTPLRRVLLVKEVSKWPQPLHNVFCVCSIVQISGMWGLCVVYTTVVCLCLVFVCECVIIHTSVCVSFLLVFVLSSRSCVYVCVCVCVNSHSLCVCLVCRTITCVLFASSVYGWLYSPLCVCFCLCTVCQFWIFNSMHFKRKLNLEVCVCVGFFFMICVLCLWFYDLCLVSLAVSYI